MWTVSEGWLEALTAGLRHIRRYFNRLGSKLIRKHRSVTRQLGNSGFTGAGKLNFVFFVLLPRIFRGQKRDRRSENSLAEKGQARVTDVTIPATSRNRPETKRR
jgi:hypothetical protein